MKFPLIAKLSDKLSNDFFNPLITKLSLNYETQLQEFQKNSRLLFFNVFIWHLINFFHQIVFLKSTSITNLCKMSKNMKNECQKE